MTAWEFWRIPLHRDGTRRVVEAVKVDAKLLQRFREEIVQRRGLLREHYEMFAERTPKNRRVGQQPVLAKLGELKRTVYL